MNQGRLTYLDALRSVCMLYGVFVHTSAFLGPEAAIGLIGTASQYFRMGTFFLVSGFLVALVAARSSVREVLGRRSVALLVPFAAAVLVVNPLTCWLIHLRHVGFMPLGTFLFDGGWRQPAAEASWHLHLWFLLSLWVYVLLFPAIGWAAGRPWLRLRLDALGRWPAEALVPAVALAVAGAAVALRIGQNLLLEPLVAGTPFAWVSFATLLYLPYFTLGVLLHASPALFERMHRVSLVGLGLGLGLVLGAGMLGDGVPETLRTVAGIVARSTLTVALVAALLAAARALVRAAGARAAPLVGSLTGSIYTVYLLHYVAIYGLGLGLLGILPAGPVYYLVLPPLVIGLLVALHRFVVAPSPALRLLLNGRWPGVPRAERSRRAGENLAAPRERG